MPDLSVEVPLTVKLGTMPSAPAATPGAPGNAPSPAAAPPAKAPPATPPADVSATDVIKRIAASPSPAPGADVPQDFKLNKDELLKGITDPTQRQFFEQKFSDAERGINEKFMRLAELRKQAETEQGQPWTPERVQALLSNPMFVQAANAHLATRQPQGSTGGTPQGWEGSGDQWTSLSEPEQKAFHEMQQKTNEANQKVDALLASNQSMLHQQEHDRLKARYTDYEPANVDAFMRQVIDNKVTGEQLKEMIHKALNFERYVERSYRLGLTDRNGNLQTKLDGSTPNTNLSVRAADDPNKPQLQPGERASKFFVRLADWNRSHKT